MNKVGLMIKELRIKKNVTQEQLGEILSVSFQTISKWERGISSPDIDLLPIICSYFGISIDELFGYRLDALTNKERFIKFLVDNGVLRFGEFELHSGKISPYYIDLAQYMEGCQLTKLGEFYADMIRNNWVQADVLYGVGRNGVLLSAITSLILFQKYGINMKYAFEKITLKQQSKYCYICGKKLDNKDEIILLSDTITTGQSIIKTIQDLTENAHITVKQIIIMVDRMESGLHSRKKAVEEVTRKFGIPIHSIISTQDIIYAIENQVIAREEYLESMKKYCLEYEE